MKKSIIAAVLAIAVISTAGIFLTGCGCNKTNPDPTASTNATANTSATAAQEKTTATAAQTQNNDSNNETKNPNDIGISKEEAVANVLSQAGNDAEVLSVEEGKSTEGFPCYVVTVSPSPDSDPVVYFSGYLFCYAENYAEEHNSDETKDPNEIGISAEEAVNNVLSQTGDSAEIISVEEGKSPEGFPCYIVVVNPDPDNAETLTYYSGYLFCYAEQ